MTTFVRAVPLPHRDILQSKKLSPARRPRVRAASTDAHVSRRALLQNATALITGTTLLPLPSAGSTLLWPSKDKNFNSASGSTVFSVLPTSVSNVNLVPIGIDEAIDAAAFSQAVFLGEHHNSLVDHALQARIIETLSKQKPVMVGLEMIQQQFQQALDKYIAREIDELDLYIATDWDKRWVWPYELYLPVLRLCRARRIPLVALSMNSETLSKLRAEGGITNLSLDEFRAHIGSATVFSEISRDPAFKAYINECITPSYAAHYRMGLLRETANFTSFYTARVLRDEAMATRAVRVIRNNPDVTLVCLMGSDHVKFEYGVKARVQRQLDALALRDQTIAQAFQSKGTSEPQVIRVPPPARLLSVMLNPGPADAYDPRDKSLKLEMAVKDNPIPIADYLWFSSVADAKPRKRAKAKLLPPVERLTSM